MTANALQNIEPEPADMDFRAAKLYLNHELSALEFNARVLAQTLAGEGIVFIDGAPWSSAQTRWARAHFEHEILPVLSPLGLNSAHPFPRILVRSVLGRFLEHSRVYWFANDGDAEIYCSSADWMERNLLRRVEACFPIRDPRVAARLFRETLQNYLDDNVQAWLLDQYNAWAPTNGAREQAVQRQRHRTKETAGIPARRPPSLGGTPSR